MKESSMKKIVCAMAFLMLCVAPLSLAQKNAATEKAIADLEHQWLKGQQTNNVDLITPLLAEGFTNTDSSGQVSNRGDSIAQAQATKYTSVDYIDLKVVVFGNTAIAIGGFKATGTSPSGPINANERFTDTWSKMANGKWQCVASQQTAVKM
jgi:ketosteroid isomerase-like protein